jgi:hypothetical protein
MGLDAADSIGRNLGLTDQPAPLNEEYPFRVAGVRNPFISRPPFGPGSKAVGKLYETSSEAEMALDTAKRMAKEGRVAEARELILRHPEARYAKFLSKARKEMSDLIALRRKVSVMDLPEHTRRERMLQIDQAMSAIAATALDRVSIEEAN